MTKPPRLQQAPSRLQALAPRIGYVPDGVDGRAFWRPDRAFYKTTRWLRLRDHVLARDLYTCRLCGRLDHDTSRLVADHIIPAWERPDLKWDPANLQTLCATCHATVKQQEDARRRLRGGG